MKIKLMILILGLGSLLQASECKIEYMGTLDKDNILSYTVNDKSIVVTLDRGMIYRIFGYVDGDKKSTLKEAYVSSSKICFGLGMKECVDVYSDDIKEHIQLFLEGNFCTGDKK